MRKNRYRNKFEEKTGEWLELQGKKFAYETESFGFTVSAKYIPDFIVTRSSGSKVYIETKGNGRSFDTHTRKKLIAVKEQHPEIDLRLVFYSDGKIGNKRKNGTFMRQSDWAKKYGFIYAIKEIPKEWLNE